MRTLALARGAAALAALSFFSAGPLAAQTLWNNGPAAVSGLSVLRPGANILGFGSNTSLSHALADNFTVGGTGWSVSGFSFFAYQTGAASTYTFTGATWSIVNGDVNTGTVVASGSGAPTNGGLVGYRVTSATLTNTDRAIFQIDLDVPDFLIGTGSYWLRWSLAGSLSTGPFVPPTADGAFGNAAQSSSGGPFSTYVETDQQGVELPFLIHGTASTVVPEPSTWALMLVGGAGLLAVARRRRPTA